jgi:hypothetical protein
MNIKLKANELKLADTIRLSANYEYPFDHATVIKIEEKEITVIRPYIQTADFSYTGGVIPYIGFEQFKIPNDNFPYLVLNRKELK